MSRCSAADLAGDRDSQAAAASENSGTQTIIANDPTPGRASTGRGLVTTAALYARVSTEKQEKEETVESQVDALRRAAGERGYEVPSEYVFVDDGYTGARMDRPGLDRLRDLATEGALDAVLVYCPDRLARQYAYQVVVVDELKRAGCEVVLIRWWCTADVASNDGMAMRSGPARRSDRMMMLNSLARTYSSASAQMPSSAGPMPPSPLSAG